MMETNYVTIREITENDARSFYDCMKSIDQETEYMMFEPDERVWNEDMLKRKINDRCNLLIGAVKDGEVIGFLSAERERFRRNRHSAYIIIGIRKEYCRKGIGIHLFSKLDEWARINGFVIEGTKKCTMLVNGNYIDEYMMAKLY